MALLLALLLAAGPARAADGPRANSISSIKKLLAGAGKMALQWSPGARLYAALGKAPGNAERWQGEDWEFFFGDPKTKDGFFHVVYADGVLSGRDGVKGGVHAVEQFSDGKLAQKRAIETEWTTNDYKDCLPPLEPFIDTAELDKRIRSVPMAPDELGRYRIALLRSRNDHCDGLGAYSLFLPEKPIPKGLRSKTLWIVTGPEETVFFDAKSGEPLLRRLRGPKPAAPPR